MDYESWMTKEELGNDGEYAHGYIDGQPATWEVSHPEEYTICREHDYFGVDYTDQYTVIDNKWTEKNSIFKIKT